MAASADKEAAAEAEEERETARAPTELLTLVLPLLSADSLAPAEELQLRQELTVTEWLRRLLGLPVALASVPAAVTEGLPLLLLLALELREPCICPPAALSTEALGEPLLLLLGLPPAAHRAEEETVALAAAEAEGLCLSASEAEAAAVALSVG